MDSKVINIDYNEKQGRFKISGENEIHSEKDLSIREINKSRSIAKKMILGDYDIYMLRYYYMKRYGKNISIHKFDTIPLKKLFPDLKESDYNLNRLMVIAYNCLQNEQVEYFHSGNQLYDGLLIILTFILVGLIYHLYARQ